MKKRVAWHRVQKKASQRLWPIFRTLILLGLSFVLLYPLLYMLSTAFRPVSEINDPSVIWIPKSLTLENFRTTIQAMKYFEALKHTMTVGVVSALFQTISCAIVGYGFARFRFREREFLFALVLLTIIIPPQTTIIPSYENFRFFKVFGMTFNLLDTVWTFWLPSLLGMGIRSGLYILVYRQFFRGIPKDIEEAAYIDGCGPFQTFVRVMAPNAKHAFVTVFLFSVVWHWNDYYLSAMFFNNNMPLAVALTRLRSGLTLMGIGDEYGDPTTVRTYLQAGSLLVIGPMLALYSVLQKYFTESLERTGIVG